MSVRTARCRLPLMLAPACSGWRKIARPDRRSAPRSDHGRILRAWGQVSLVLGPSRSGYVELEAYDALLGLEGATAGGWRFLSISAGLRWALR